MTESELAKVRELVGAQRELWTAASRHQESYPEARDRHRRAFLAVEAMVATEESAE